VNETRIEIADFYEGVDLSETFTRAEFERLNEHLFKRTLEKVGQVLADAKLSPRDISDVVLVGGSTRCPAVRRLVSEFFGGRELCTSINPDEAIAAGAAIQAQALAAEGQGTLVVVDVYPLTLGVETHGGVMSTIIERNARIPVQRKRRYTTHNDDAAGARIAIYEGERKLTRDNRLLDVFTLMGLPASKRGKLDIDVTFTINSNALLTVTASESSSGSTDSLTIDTLEFALSQREIEEAVESAELFAEEDERDLRRVVERVKYEGALLDWRRDIKTLRRKGTYDATQYKNVKAMLKARRTWLDTHPMEAAETYTDLREGLGAEIQKLILGWEAKDIGKRQAIEGL
jgi:molecular chaperone DnaK (HSP70)